MKRSRGENIFNVFNIIFMLFLILVTLYPYLNQVAISLNDGKDTMMGGITIFPRKLTFENYVTVFENPSFSRAAVNSVLRTVLGTLVGLFITTGAAYALSKKKLPGRTFVLTLLLIPMFINGGLIPTIILYRNLGLMNNMLVYILPQAFAFFYMIIVRTYIDNLPNSLEESAIIDGANEVQVLFKIILPLCKPVMATIALWIGVTLWNDWVTSLYFVTKKELYTLQFVMYKVVKEAELINELVFANLMKQGSGAANDVYVPKVTPESIKAATVVIVTLPIIAFYPFLQKYFVKGIIVRTNKV